MAKFAPGRSGNPAGRPRKPRTGPDKLRTDLLREAPGILAKLVELAMAGDVSAAKEVLGRCLPPLRAVDRPVTIALGSELSAAGRAVIEALGAGELTPSEASALASTIGALARSNELIAVEQRLRVIEHLLNERSN